MCSCGYICGRGTTELEAGLTYFNAFMNTGCISQSLSDGEKRMWQAACCQMCGSAELSQRVLSRVAKFARLAFSMLCEVSAVFPHNITVGTLFLGW